MEKKQSFGLRKKDLAVIGALLLLAVSCWLAYRLSYRPPEKQNLAVIMVDGQGSDAAESAGGKGQDILPGGGLRGAGIVSN